MGKLYRRIKEVMYKPEDPDLKKPIRIRVYVPDCGWGVLEEFNESGNGYIKFDDGGGTIVRNWENFFNMVQIIDTGVESK